jgi:hypothetical protein
MGCAKRVTLHPKNDKIKEMPDSGNCLSHTLPLQPDPFEGASFHPLSTIIAPGITARHWIKKF